MKHSVALVIPYFNGGGGMPAYFPYWLKTCGCNKDINFILYTDLCLSRMSVPDNVRVVQSSFEEFKLDLQAVMPFPVEIDTPYKLCDCRPLFGAALEDDLRSFEYWGFCDCDLLFGELYPFLFPDNANLDAQRIFSRGHLSIFKNNELNRWAWRDLPDSGCQNWADALTNAGPRCYDEWGGHVGGGMSMKYANNNILIDDRQEFADIRVYSHDFHVVREKYPEYKWETFDANRVFYWCNGQLAGLSVTPERTVRITRYAYCHFQKRQLRINGNPDGAAYILSPPNHLISLDAPLDLDTTTIHDVKKMYGTHDYLWELRTFSERLGRKIQKVVSV